MNKQFTVVLFLFFFVNGNSQTINDLIPRDESFYIQSAINYSYDQRGYWDIPGNSAILRERSPLIVSEFSSPENDRKYAVRRSSVPGFVKIHIDGIAGFLDFIGRSDSNGVRLIFNKPNEKGNQDFTFRYSGHGRFKIYNRNGKVISLENRSSDSGRTVILWDDNDGPWTEWVLISAVTNKPLLPDDKINERRRQTSEDMTGTGALYIQSAMCFGKNASGFWRNSGNKLSSGDLKEVGQGLTFNVLQSISDFAYYNIVSGAGTNLILSADPAGSAVTFREADLTGAQNFRFQYSENGRFKIYAQDGRVLALKDAAEKTNGYVELTEDSEEAHTEWYLIDSEKNRIALPEGKTIQQITLDKFSVGEPGEITDALRLIDEVYENVNRLQPATEQTLSKISALQRTIGGAFLLTSGIEKMTARMNNTLTAADPLTKIPVIGLALKPLTITLDFSKTQLENVKTGIDAFKKPVIDPVYENISFAFSRVITLKTQLSVSKEKLYSLKRDIYEMYESGEYDKAIMFSGSVSERLKSVLSAMGMIGTALSQVDMVCDVLNKIQEPVGKVNTGLAEFEKKYREIDKIADEVNEVLDRRLAREIAGVKIDVSLREVLNGGDISSSVEGYVQNWAEGVMRPLIEKFNIKLPELPGILDFKSVLAGSVDAAGEAKKRGAGIEMITDSIAPLLDQLIFEPGSR